MNRRTFLGITIPIFFLPSLCSGTIIPVQKISKPIRGLHLGKKFVYGKIPVEVQYHAVVNAASPLTIEFPSYITQELLSDNVDTQILNMVRNLYPHAKKTGEKIWIHISDDRMVGCTKWEGEHNFVDGNLKGK